MGKRKTHEEFEKEFYYKNNKAILLGKFVDCYTKIKVCCVNDNSHIWEAKPSNLLNNTGCPICRKLNKYSSKDHYISRLNACRKDIKLIGDYSGLETITEFECIQGHRFFDKPRALLPTKGVLKMCPQCKKLKNNNKHDEFVKRVNNMNNDVIVIGYFENSHTKIEFGCKNNPNHKWITYPYNILSGTKCPFCFKEKSIHLLGNKQYLAETHPDITSLLQDKNNGYKYSYGSGEIVNFICPDCKNIIPKKICDVTHYGLVCKKCSNNYSYPNKFMSFILDSLNVDYIAEYYSDWTQGRYYDFYFVIDDKKYIIEMDGIFHFQDIHNCLQKNIENDKLKDTLAANHNIELIRIDCNYDDIKNRFLYIKNNILNSILSQIFDFSNVNFEQCDKNASMSTLKYLAELWNDGYQDLQSLSDKMKIGKNYVSKHIKNAARLNLLCDSPEVVDLKIKQNGYKNSAKANTSNGQKIKCVETGEIFGSIMSATKKYNTKSIYKYFYGQCKYAGQLPNGTKLTWVKI